MITSKIIEPPIDIVEEGLAVIRQEARALEALAHTVNASFADAVRLLVATPGRIIVAGIGKSGHIGRKVAATLSATGTSAYFLHAGEAMHGDLGMLRADDTMIVLSNSGKTPELRPLVDHALAIGVPMVAVVADPGSWLAEASDYVLMLPKVPEACPERIAPTTSSTMMLALGDALAVAAMRLRGVSRRELVGWHPGGNIGRDAMPVSLVVRRGDPLPLVVSHAGMRDVVFEMTSAGKGVAGVVDDAGDLIGIITDGDLRRGFDRMLIATAAEIMTANPRTVLGSVSVAEARHLMTEAKITVMFMMDTENPTRPVAVLHIHDLAPTA
ncbi:arabinose-5-phosphate isomerase [Sphingomonas zeicaulis]|uniref:KpsF/GutQ family sugar-phosphate isomerase n=1 Tax=Sphingomonas zeicaulis TaxID=1632740 RepID=UPI003D1B2490